MCGGSYQCAYDFIMTERRDVAVFTKFYQDEFVNIKSSGLETSQYCDIISKPSKCCTYLCSNVTCSLVFFVTAYNVCTNRWL